MNIERKYQRLMERRYGATQTQDGYQRLANSSRAKVSKALNYIIDAMDEIDPEMALRAGNRVKDELTAAFEKHGLSVDFDFQGSTTNGTNIKKNSDIDLLVVRSVCFSAEPGTHVNYPDYAGSILDEVLEIRKTCISELKTRYWAASVLAGGKSIKVSGGSLERDVDVVPCNWYRSADHERNPTKTFLGVRIRDTERGVWIRNFPFLHNALIDLKDRRASGNLRKLIRLLKNLREDAEITIKVSSYDIMGLAYLMGDESFTLGYGESVLDLCDRLSTMLEILTNSPELQAQATVPHGKDKLFSAQGLQASEVKKLNGELRAIVRDARVGLQPNFFSKMPSSSLWDSYRSLRG